MATCYCPRCGWTGNTAAEYCPACDEVRAEGYGGEDERPRCYRPRTRLVWDEDVAEGPK